MKSLVYWAPALPPPPYTSLMTRPVPAGLAVAGGVRASGPATIAKQSVAAPPRPHRRLDVLLKLLLLGAGRRASALWAWPAAAEGCREKGRGGRRRTDGADSREHAHPEGV